MFVVSSEDRPTFYEILREGLTCTTRIWN